MMTVKELFNDWIDADIGQYYLACLLGIMEYDESFGAFRNAKGVFWSNNKVGNALYEMLEKMVEGGILEKNDEIQYRWNNSFKGYWDGGNDG